MVQVETGFRGELGRNLFCVGDENWRMQLLQGHLHQNMASPTHTRDLGLVLGCSLFPCVIDSRWEYLSLAGFDGPEVRMGTLRIQISISTSRVGQRIIIIINKHLMKTNWQAEYLNLALLPLRLAFLEFSSFKSHLLVWGYIFMHCVITTVTNLSFIPVQAKSNTLYMF